MKNFQIGWYILNEDTSFTDRGYECAAWSQTILVPAGKYPVTAREFDYHERDKHYTNRIKDTAIFCKLEGVITGSDFTSHFYGVPFGSGQIDKNKGKTGTYILSPYSHSLAINILEGNAKEWELLDEFEAREIPFISFDGTPSKTYGIFKK